MPADLDHLVEDVVGTELLAYLIATSEETLVTCLSSHAKLTPAQASVLEQLAAEFADPAAGPRAAFDALLEQDLYAGMSRANVLHRDAGGIIEEPADLEPVAAALARMARDLYPALLLRKPLIDSIRREVQAVETAVGGALHGFTLLQDPLMPARPQLEGWLFPRSLQHPAFNEFRSAAQVDDDFKLLLPHHGEVMQGALAASIHSAQTVQLPSIPWMLLSAASFRLRTLHAQHDRSTFVNEVMSGLDQLRRISRGETLQVPALAGFTGLDVPVGMRIETPWGRIRRVTEFDAELMPSTAEATAVLETSAPLAFAAYSDLNDEMELLQPDPFPEIERNQTLAALALLLGCTPATLAPSRTWQYVFPPIYPFPGEWRRSPTPASPISHTHLHAGAEHVFEAWALRVAEHHDPSIDIAAQRLLSALTVRPDPIDGFIDAVIAWENLLGSRESELSFRITAALAHLLGENSADRMKIQAQAVKLYRRRNDVVHGSSHPTPTEAVQLRSEAVDLALAALRRLFSARPDLIADKQRGKRLILE